MNLQQIAERASAIATDLETLTALPEWTDEQRSQFDALNTELGGLEARKADIEARSAVLARAQSMTATGDAPARYSAPNINKPKDPFDLNELRYGAPVAELRGRAKAAVGYLSSLGIGTAQIFLWRLVPEASASEIAATLAGGPVGIAAAMWLHPRLAAWMPLLWIALETRK